MEINVKETFTLAGFNCPCEIFLTSLGNAHGHNNLLSFLALSIRDFIAVYINAGRNGDYYVCTEIKRNYTGL